MKKAIVSVCMIFLALFVHNAYAIGGYIRPPIIILNERITSNVFNFLPGFVEVGNPNSFPIEVYILSADYIVLEATSLPLDIGEIRRVNYTAVIPKWGTYSTSIDVTYSGEHGLPLTLSADLTIHAIQNESGVNIDPPSPPLLISPVNNSANTGSDVLFRWNASIDSEGNNLIYYYQVDDDSDFSSPEYFGFMIGTEKLLEIQKGRRFFWRIIASDSIHNTSSEERSFIVKNNPPNTPSLFSPAHNAHLNQEPTLTWSGVSDPDGDEVSYEVFLDESNDFSSPEILPRKSTSYDLSLLNLVEGEYYWKVRAFDGIGYSYFSGARKFTLECENPACVDIDILSPKSGTHSDKRLLVDAGTSKKAGSIYYSLNSKYFRLACKNCDSFSRYLYGREGYNNLTIRILAYNEVTAYESLGFYIDTKKPRIHRIEPKNDEYVGKDTLFTVKYTEDNLEGAMLVYGTDSDTRALALSCPSGRSQECSIAADLSDYHGKEIFYYFVLNDAVSSVESAVNTLAVDAVAPVIHLFSPTGYAYDNRRVRFTIDVSEDVKLERSSGNKFRSLCRNCDSYDKDVYLREGVHHVTIRATDKAGNQAELSTMFIVDSTKPRIYRTEPKNDEYVGKDTLFTVKYTESNLEGVTLFYGNGLINRERALSCESGRYRECSVSVDLSEFDGQEIHYYFSVKDAISTVESKVYSLRIDATPPEINLLSPLGQTYYTYRIPFEIESSEVLDRLEKSDNGGGFRLLCRNCNRYERNVYYLRNGIYELLIRAKDKAGNVGYASVNFTVER